MIKFQPGSYWTNLIFFSFSVVSSSRAATVLTLNGQHPKTYKKVINLFNWDGIKLEMFCLDLRKEPADDSKWHSRQFSLSFKATMFIQKRNETDSDALKLQRCWKSRLGRLSRNVFYCRSFLPPSSVHANYKVVHFRINVGEQLAHRQFVGNKIDVVLLGCHNRTFRTVLLFLEM